MTSRPGYGCLYSVSPLHGDVGWSVVYKCGISWSYLLTFHINGMTLESKVKVITLNAIYVSEREFLFHFSFGRAGVPI